MVPVRTGLDERLEQLRDNLVEDASELMKIYEISINSLISLDVEHVNQVLDAREKARIKFWERTGDILLVISMNQPMMGDLRMISTYLRGTDTIERGMRHARDISQISLILKNQAGVNNIPSNLVNLIQIMNEQLFDLISNIFESINSKTNLDVDYISNKWSKIGETWESCQEIISQTPGSEIGSKIGRLNLFRALSRIERTGYNFVRFADLWHHALNNEWISIEN
ncbi:MAG: hypothetical protein ISR09_00275 [Candidatus Thalassarchaeum sp.]|nr:hypothetical protein [Candidatus Thalassarchaeum sp.]